VAVTIVEGVIGVIGEVGCGDNFGECSCEVNDTPGASSGEVKVIVMRMIIQ
jgi:hypothetical protein